MFLYIVRHGETIWNRKEIIQGHKDSSLTSKGKRSAQRIGRRFRNEGIARIYSSDLGRCIKTAEMINKNLNVKLIRTSKLREQNFGRYNGKPDWLIRGKIDLPNPNSKFSGIESFNQMKKRIMQFVYSLAFKDFEKILIVTHEGPLRAILSDYYHSDFYSKKCNSSSDSTYKFKLGKHKLEKLCVLN